MKTSKLKSNYLSIHFCNVILNKLNQLPDVVKLFNTLFMSLQIKIYNISLDVNSRELFILMPFLKQTMRWFLKEQTNLRFLEFLLRKFFFEKNK